MMTMVELEQCTLLEAPKKLPQKLRDSINNIINAIDYAKNGNYECYFTLNNQNIIKYKKDSEEWSRYIKHLNRCNRCFCLISDVRMTDAWNKFAKGYKDSYDYSMLFIWLTNAFCGLIKYEEESTPLGLPKNITDKIDFMIELRENPEILLDKAKKVFDIFKDYMTLIAPDEADCFEDDDNPPYKINWDLLITDDEYFTFINIFKKILEKLENQKKLKESKAETITKFLHNPKSRKKNIDGALEIKLAKMLYTKFMQDYNKPFYKEIALILNILFGSPYCENDIVKITKPVRDNYKELEQIIKENGYEHYYFDSDIPKNIARNLKSEDSK